MPADISAALVAMLRADLAVAAKAGTRVFAGELPGKEAASMPRAALVLRPSGGAALTGGSYAEHDAQRFDLYGYGATPAEAALVLLAAALRLRRTEREVWPETGANRVLIHACRSAGGYVQGRDPDTDWPRAWQSFQIFHALESIT